MKRDPRNNRRPCIGLSQKATDRQRRPRIPSLNPTMSSSQAIRPKTPKGPKKPPPGTNVPTASFPALWQTSNIAMLAPVFNAPKSNFKKPGSPRHRQPQSPLRRRGEQPSKDTQPRCPEQNLERGKKKFRRRPVRAPVARSPIRSQQARSRRIPRVDIDSPPRHLACAKVVGGEDGASRPLLLRGTLERGYPRRPHCATGRFLGAPMAAGVARRSPWPVIRRFAALPTDHREDRGE